MSYNYLLDHAIKNVWCTPDQDNQNMFKLFRLTRFVGDKNRTTIMGRDITLPESGKIYHVFQIGQLNPKIIGMLSLRKEWMPERWICFKDIIEATNIFVNIYTDYGVELPKFRCYYKLTNEKNLIIAVEEDPKIKLDYGRDDIYLRVYSNAFFESDEADPAIHGLKYRYLEAINSQAILNFSVEYNTFKALHGFVFAYCNGLLIDKVDLVNIAVGDTVEFIYDSSVKKIVTFTVKNLKSFTSELDNEFKYLLRHSSLPNDTIDYQDDIDIHVLLQTGTRYKGYYYNRNSESSHRMVTHRDYSISHRIFNIVADKLKETLNLPGYATGDLKVQIKIRKSGYHRPLVFDNNRIFELYKLSGSLIDQAMTGLDAGVPVWKASKLENSGYTKLMRSKLRDINLDVVQKAYGYNAISKLLADGPMLTYEHSSRKKVNLGYGLHQNSTMYEYDVNGHLLGVYHHINGEDYECINNDAHYVEGICGIGDLKPNVKFGFTDIPINPLHNFRVYKCTRVNGIPQNDWVDITGQTSYRVDNGLLKWNNILSNPANYTHYLMVRQDDKFLAYHLDIYPIAGTLYFTFNELQNHGSGFVNHTLPIPLGELDLWLNGKPLIEDLDYIVKFPKVYIINKKYLNNPVNSTSQRIHVRFTGFCNNDLIRDKPDDYGFIEHGVLSNNSKFDIRDDKVLRIIVDGALYHRNELTFSETTQGISVTDARNGLPYQIKDIVVPLKGLTDENTYSLRAKSNQIDKELSDYLSVYLPQPARNAVSAIRERYPVVSPFFSHLIHDLATKQINIDENNYKDILGICKPYEFLLEFDPIHDSINLNKNYVIVHPHLLNETINMNLMSYQFLMKVIEQYGNGLIDISSFVTFTA